MKARIQKWGNSLALRIPKALADEAGLEQHRSVELALVDGQIMITPHAEDEYQLDDLLSKITPDNLHAEIDTGYATGNEVW
jgi:antitoxin MazE